MSEKNCEDEYAKLWRIYGDLEDERDRLERENKRMREALLSIVEDYDAARDMSWQGDTYAETARCVLKELGYE